MGLVLRVVPPEDCLKETLALAAEIAANAPLAVQATKRMMRLGLDETFEPEFVNAFEVGVKNTLLDNTLQANISLFYYDYTDQQVPYFFTDPVSGLLNTKRGRILGASIVGEHAGELIQMWSLAISQKMKIKAMTDWIGGFAKLARAYPGAQPAVEFRQRLTELAEQDREQASNRAWPT